MDALWPGEDPAVVSNRLSVAASVARSVLDPDKRFSSGHFIAGDSESLRLVADHVAVDVEDFIAEAEGALNPETDGAERLEYAESLYAGDFLEDDPYADWAVPLREETRALSRAVLRALAQRAVGDADHERAVRYLLRMLERDPHDEDASLELVKALERAGRPGEARRHYRTYTSRMDELGVEAAPYPARARVSTQLP
jgi:DNA-binding SARP family transcriptional activator